jgi:hypothetical protein
MLNDPDLKKLDHRHDRDSRPTDTGPYMTSASIQRSQDESAQEKPRSTAGAVVTRLLAVLVVAMVVTSILGFMVFDRQGGNSTTAVASLAIGSSAAVLGLVLGFAKAYQTT